MIRAVATVPPFDSLGESDAVGLAAPLPSSSNSDADAEHFPSYEDTFISQVRASDVFLPLPFLGDVPRNRASSAWAVLHAAPPKVPTRLPRRKKAVDAKGGGSGDEKSADSDHDDKSDSEHNNSKPSSSSPGEPDSHGLSWWPQLRMVPPPDAFHVGSLPSTSCDSDAKPSDRDRDQGGSSRRQTLEEGMKIKANYRGKGKFFPGRIRRDNRDGTYDIEFDDGDRETDVREIDIQADGGHDRYDNRDRDRDGPARRQKLEEGMKVKANYRGKGKFFGGRISRDNCDGTYDIDYDDGERERGVRESEIEPQDRGGGGTDGGGDLREGAKVEARYRGKTRYYPGRIGRDRGDGTYDIDYDDGEREQRVMAELIRSLE